MEKNTLKKLTEKGYKPFMYENKNKDEEISVIVWNKEKEEALKQIKEIAGNKKIKETDIKEISGQEALKLNKDQETKIEKMKNEFFDEVNKHFKAFDKFFEHFDNEFLGFNNLDKKLKELFSDDFLKLPFEEKNKK